MGQSGMVRVSVRALAEYACTGGNLESVGSLAQMQEGTRLHHLLQHRIDGYRAEVFVRGSAARANIALDVGGRIDGLFEEHGEMVLEEIKSTALFPASFGDAPPAHIAQAVLYGYLYATQHDLDHLIIQLTYARAHSEEFTSFRRRYTADELSAEWTRITDLFLGHLIARRAWRSQRNIALRRLEFPFPQLRIGQQELIGAVDAALENRELLFAQAPTGIGKTMAVLYPALRALARGQDKLFYLTARTTARQIAEDALGLLADQGLRLRCLTLTAKEAICFSPGCACTSDECPYAAGFFDRLREAEREALDTHQAFTRRVIERAARAHRICPFEFSLSLSEHCDVVIGDYNYAFDPRVQLKRYFVQGGAYALLIDEAHNLVDRARNMYSASFSLAQVRALQAIVSGEPLAQAELLGRILGAAAHWFDACRARLEEHGASADASEEKPAALLDILEDAAGAIADWTSIDEPFARHDAFADLYFAALDFVRTGALYGARHVTYWYTGEGDDLTVALFCVDASAFLRAVFGKTAGAVLFSATLSPLSYFRDMLGGDEDATMLALDSPFPQENLCFLIEDAIATDYRSRGMSYGDVAAAIAAVVRARAGNYIAYFPSYAYLRAVRAMLPPLLDGVALLVQTPNMRESERSAFLAELGKADGEARLALAVMGGVFGEGIDLTGEKLLGAIVVGVGLPQIGLERDIVKAWFDHEEKPGFAYAYVYPGMNKVLQAAGRVIRTESDRGVVLLIDRRFSTELYETLLPAYYQPRRVQGAAAITEELAAFWD